MVLILMGKSSSGKDTILKEFVKREDFIPIISDTTRPMRIGEVDGVDYNFVDYLTFQERDRNGRYLEKREYRTTVDGDPATWYYGCPVNNYEDTDKHYIAVFDVGGAKDFIEAVGAENVIACYIDCDDNVRRKRAETRSPVSDEEWNNRLKDDAKRFAPSKLKDVATFSVDSSEMSIDEVFTNVLEGFFDFML